LTPYHGTGIIMQSVSVTLNMKEVVHGGLMPVRGRVSVFFTAVVVTVFAILSAYLLGTVLVCGLIRNASWCAWWPHIPLARLEEFIRASGGWGVAVSIGIMVIHSFIPFPAEFVAIANGVIYGVIWGTVITWTGAMLGAFLAFGLARKLGQHYVHRRLKEKNRERVEDWIARHGGTAILLSRLIPVISFNLINYLAGLSKISPWTFGWTTAIGILPLTFLMVVMGDRVQSMSWEIWLLLAGAGVFFLLISRLPFWRKLR